MIDHLYSSEVQKIIFKYQNYTLGVSINIYICILVPEGLHDRSPISLGSTEDHILVPKLFTRCLYLDIY